MYSCSDADMYIFLPRLRSTKIDRDRSPQAESKHHFQRRAFHIKKKQVKVLFVTVCMLMTIISKTCMLRLSYNITLIVFF